MISSIALYHNCESFMTDNERSRFRTDPTFNLEEWVDELREANMSSELQRDVCSSDAQNQNDEAA